jgi:hypothetical protein
VRSGKINFVAVIIVLALIVGGLFLHTFGAYYWDAMHMKEVARNACFTFQERDESKGLQRLTQELYQREIPDYIVEDDCDFIKKHGKHTVRCYWEVEKAWPFTNITRVMAFEVEATRDKHGFID